MYERVVDMFTSKTEITVRYAETDKMGIVHHSNYPIWYEAGRTDFIKKLGMSYSSLEERGIMLPLIELKCKFLKSAYYEDELVVKTSIKSLSYTRISFYYEVFRKSSGEMISTGETMHVWTDRKIKPVNIKKHLPEIYELMLSKSQ
jgi:acyl-CoA thioester hydrolase